MNHNDHHYHQLSPLLPNPGSTVDIDIQFVDMEALTRAGLQVKHFLVGRQDYPTNGAAIARNQIIVNTETGFNHNVSQHANGITDPCNDDYAKQLYSSENGIPPQLLDEVFQLDDEMKARGKRSVEYPVKPQLSMEEYEKELVAEMESLFPSTTHKSRLMQELTRIGIPNSPCPMNLYFRGGHNVDLVDVNGRQYRARFCGRIPVERLTPFVYRQNSVPIKSHDNRSAVYTELIKPTVSCSQIEAADGVCKPKTIIIKAPKRTIASSSGEEPDKSLAYSRIKRVADEEALHQELSVIDSTTIEVPMLPSATATSNGKQPRKQKLKSLSQCDVVFRDSEEGNAASGTNCPTVTDKDSNIVDRQPRRQQLTNSISPRASFVGSERICTTKKRAGNTHLPVQGTPKCNQLPVLPVNPIEILDSSDESNDAQAGHNYARKADNKSKKAKFLGNTDSIQCPICFKVFFSSKMLIQHSQSCADVLQKQKNQSMSFTNMINTMKTDKPTDGGGQLTPTKHTPSDKQLPSETKRKRPSASQKRSERLSIEILSTAFNIANLLLCDVCQKTFRAQEHLDMHKKIHKAPTVCQFCKRKFYETPLKHVCHEKKRSMESKRKTRR